MGAGWLLMITTTLCTIVQCHPGESNDGPLSQLPHQTATNPQPTITATVATLKVDDRTGLAPLVQTFGMVRYLHLVVSRVEVALC